MLVSLSLSFHLLEFKLEHKLLLLLSFKFLLSPEQSLLFFKLKSGQLELLLLLGQLVEAGGLFASKSSLALQTLVLFLLAGATLQLLLDQLLLKLELLFQLLLKTLELQLLLPLQLQELLLCPLLLYKLSLEQFVGYLLLNALLLQ